MLLRTVRQRQVAFAAAVAACLAAHLTHVLHALAAATQRAALHCRLLFVPL